MEIESQERIKKIRIGSKPNEDCYDIITYVNILEDGVVRVSTQVIDIKTGLEFERKGMRFVLKEKELEGMDSFFDLD